MYIGISHDFISPLSSLSFQFLLSSEFTQRARPGSQASLPACAAMPRGSPAPSWPGWRTAWTSQPSCPNSSRCKVQREFRVYCSLDVHLSAFITTTAAASIIIFTTAVTNTLTATFSPAIVTTTKINATIIPPVSTLTNTAYDYHLCLRSIGLGQDDWISLT